ncbi:hypothetical protein [Spiroplasma diminutum]|uniref:Uncharacterized protein n=1 Tax=Spiroplasma diminutum CUAS-1 TaxID=1276221 RepID=S5MEU8_9MOLU|nr:hypothetical protein [Spiroplasma diminutum]AGR42293.1 hypothetical protein SDIMI_v3c05890 [Spiroplasma diminutum CUAS-1]
MPKYYKNNNFWMGAGADHTFNCLKLMGGDCSIAEVFTAMESKILDFAEEEIVKIKNDNTNMLIDAWAEIRRLILLKDKEVEENTGTGKFVVSDFKDLYLILNKAASIYDFFLNESDDNDVYNSINEVLKLTADLNTAEEIIPVFSIFLHENYVKGTFGTNTQLFCWFMLQLLLINKGAGPIISFPNRYFEMLEMFPTSNLLNGEIIQSKGREWVESEYFKKLTNFWIKKSNEYYKFIEENYIQDN